MDREMTQTNGKVVACAVIGFAILAIIFSCYAIFQPQQTEVISKTSSKNQLSPGQLAEMQDHVLGHVPIQKLDVIVSAEKKFVDARNNTAEKKFSTQSENSIRVISPENTLDDSDTGATANDQWKKMF